MYISLVRLYSRLPFTVCRPHSDFFDVSFSYMLPLSRRGVVNALRFSWVLVVLWHEFGVFSWVLRDCHWPHSQQVCALVRVIPYLLRVVSTQSPNSRIARVLVIADPQVLDRHSYPERGSFLSSITQLMVDLNLRRSWHATIHRLQPDAVVVLGMHNSLRSYEY